MVNSSSRVVRPVAAARGGTGVGGVATTTGRTLCEATAARGTRRRVSRGRRGRGPVAATPRRQSVWFEEDVDAVQHLPRIQRAYGGMGDEAGFLARELGQADVFAEGDAGHLHDHAAAGEG